jgi:hypothetical protein
MRMQADVTGHALSGASVGARAHRFSADGDAFISLRSWQRGLAAPVAKSHKCLIQSPGEAIRGLEHAYRDASHGRTSRCKPQSDT